MDFNMDQVSCKSRENIYVNTQSLDDLLFDVFSSVLFLLGRLSEIQAIGPLSLPALEAFRSMVRQRAST